MDEFETIKRQMEARRNSLAEKLEALESQVAETVQGVTSAVSNVKDVVQDTVESVKDSVETVKGSVQDTVGAVQDSFDLGKQMDKHPLILLGGAFAAGFLAGQIVPDGPAAEPQRPAGTGGRPRGHDGASNGGAAAWPTSLQAESPTVQAQRPSWLQQLGQSLAPEIDKFKGLALGAALGLVRDYVKQATPPDLGTQLAGMIDSVTSKLGGQPVRDNLAGNARSSYQYSNAR